jgi:NO-binding membrane sensor protein with MHYT domain
MVIAGTTHLGADYAAGQAALSFIFTTIGSFAALASARRVRSTTGIRRLTWIGCVAGALGCGAVWSTHVISPAIDDVSSDISFDLSTVFLALLIAVAAAGIGTGIVAADPGDPRRWLGGGVSTGFGIAAANYTGMAATSATCAVSYNAALVLVSVAIAVAAGVAVFRVAFEVERTGQAFGASVVISGAICGMHYTALAATSVTVSPTASGEAAVDPYTFGVVTTVGSAVVMMLIVFAALSGADEPEFERQCERELAVRRTSRPQVGHHRANPSPQPVRGGGGGHAIPRQQRPASQLDVAASRPDVPASRLGRLRESEPVDEPDKREDTVPLAIHERGREPVDRLVQRVTAMR